MTFYSKSGPIGGGGSYIRFTVASASDVICAHRPRRFVEAFKLLENAPKEEHCWCTYGKIMDPLLEPFSFFFEQPQSDLHALWRRLCSELNACTKCVIAYHGSKERYSKTYHEAHVEPLLTVLQVYALSLFLLVYMCPRFLFEFDVLWEKNDLFQKAVLWSFAPVTSHSEL